MTTTSAAMAEIVRVGGWALRGLGYPFGVAERAIRILAWAEAVHGGTLRSLHEAQSAIAETTTPAPLARRREGRAAWRIDGRGKHLMEVGPPAIDLLTSDAREHGFSHVTMTQTIGGGLVAALADLAARRGLACIAVFRAAEDDVLPDGVARSGWLAAAPAQGGTLFAVGDLKGAADVILSLVAAAAHDQAPLIRQDVANSLEASAESYLGLSAARLDAEMESRLRAAAASGDLELVDYSGRLAEGYRSGVAMEAADLLHLYALERLTWAPTSERSRSQAGYGRY